MSLKNLFVYIVVFILSVFSLSANAQSSKQDSITAARKRIMDSTRVAQKRVLDSTKASRAQALKTMNAARQKRTDSLAAIRKYKESKRFKDSVARSRQRRTDSVKLVRTRSLDSSRAVRQRSMDSAMAARKEVIDAMRAVQKRRTDSLGAIRQYKESKRYKDSVVVVRKMRMDSLKADRKVFNDSVAASRKRINDSATAVRKATMDSTMAVRKKNMDSITAVRKVRTDSLAKAKAARDKLKEIRLKEKEDKMKLAMELKIKKKQEAWTNEKMLKKRWSLPRQIFQNTYTRYNYYFNADRKMDEALDNMQRFRRENYDSLVALFPFDPDRDSTVLAPDMDSIIQKASVGIQIHDPRTKWADDLYLLLGQAYYYKGDYKNAAIAFRYIVSINDKYKKKSNARTSTASKAKGASIAEAEDKKLLDFLKHKTAHNEALLWLARTYTEGHQEGNAESVIDLLEADPNMPKSLKGRLALEKSYLYLSQGNISQATTQLTIVSSDSELPDWVRMRAAFLNGQLLQKQGKHKDAVVNYEQVLALNPKLEMDFYARRNLTYSLIESGGNQETTMAALKKVLNDGKYAPYYEQVYYMIGRLAANSNNTKEAISYLNKSISTPKSTRKQKALSFAALGGVYYNMRDYMASKNAYDSASVFGSAAPGDSLIVLAMRRNMVLTKVTTPVTGIKNADSLLHLSSMSRKDQEAVVRKYIRRLVQEKEDSAFRAENAGVQNAMQQQSQQGGGQQQGTSFANWYFANPVLMQQGFNEFKRKWNNRPLADNWRRSSAGGAANIANNTAASGDNEDSEQEAELDENGIPTEKGLLAFIPNTNEKQNALRNKSMQYYMDLAKAYLNDLEDYPQVPATLDTLDKRYPKHGYKAEGVYLRYMAALRSNRMDDAKKYSAQLLQDYGDTKWAQLVRPSEDKESASTVSGASVANFYDESYGLLLQRQYGEVLQRMQIANSQYNDGAYRKRFRIMEAIALVGSGNYNRADTMLHDFISSHPSDSLRIWAETTLDYIKKNRPVTPPAAAAATPVDSTGKALKPAAAAAAASATKDELVTDLATDAAGGQKDLPVPLAFSYKPGEEHYVIFSFATMEKRAMGVKAGMTDFNTFRFGGQGLNTTISRINDNQGIITTKQFKNASQAKVYMNSLRSTGQLFREYKSGEYNIFLISASNYLKMMADKNLQPYMNFYKTNYK